MKHLSSKEFSEMLKQHNQETKVAHKKKLYNKITKEVKNLSMENNDRRKILNSYQRFLKKLSGGGAAGAAPGNNIPKNIMENIQNQLNNLSTVCENIKTKIEQLKGKLPAGIESDVFEAKDVQNLYKKFSESALFKEPIESYYAILNNPNLIGKFSPQNKKISAKGTELGTFVEMKGTNKFLSDVIFSKIAIGAYDDEYLPNNLTQKAYEKWVVQNNNNISNITDESNYGTQPHLLEIIESQFTPEEENALHELSVLYRANPLDINVIIQIENLYTKKLEQNKSLNPSILNKDKEVLKELFGRNDIGQILFRENSGSSNSGSLASSKSTSNTSSNSGTPSSLASTSSKGSSKSGSQVSTSSNYSDNFNSNNGSSNGTSSKALSVKTNMSSTSGTSKSSQLKTPPPRKRKKEN
jgi:hypothetical protein